MSFAPVNWLAIIVAVILQQALGAVWFGPLFAKAWMAEVGKKEEDLRGGAVRGYAIAIIGSLVEIFILSQAIVAFGATTIVSGAITAALLWLGFTAAPALTNGTFAGRSTKLWSMESGYFLVGAVISGAILAVWR